MLIVNNTQPPQGRETHARKNDVAPGHLSFNRHPILEGHNDSLVADLREGDSGGVANEGGDLRVRDNVVLEKTCEDTVPDVA